MRQPVMLNVLERLPIVIVRATQPRERRGADVLGAVEDQVLVHLVGEDEEIVALREVGDELELGSRPDLA